MKISFNKFLVSSLLLVSFVGFSATVQDILTRCDDLQTRISALNVSVNSVLTRLQNAKYTTNENVNGEYVERIYPVSNIGAVADSIHILQNYSETLFQMNSDVGMIRQYASSLTSSGGSYDDTDLKAKLDEFEEVLNTISTSVDDIKQLEMDFMGWFTENQDKITDYFDNWGNFTNSLPSNAFYNYLTNRVSSTSGSQRNQINGFPFYFYNFSSGKFSSSPVFTTSWGHYNPYLNDSNSIDISKIKNLPDLFSLLHFDLTYGFNGIGNNLYTNTVDTISFHRDYQRDFKSYSDFTTNKFHEIVSIFNTTSPLERINEDSNPSNIYNFVTNYYIKVSTNPSGSDDENHTNWFNRVEMLLAALVFRPQEVAPSNDFSNVEDNEKKQFEDSIKDFLDKDIGDIQQNSENVLSDFEKTKTSLLNFFGHLDDKLSSLASIPSHIEFFEITTSSGNTKKVEIATQGAFASYADTLRAISTLCWVSFFVYVIFVLSRWLFVKFSTILKFCYSVFKTLIGIG